MSPLLSRATLRIFSTDNLFIKSDFYARIFSVLKCKIYYNHFDRINML